MKRIVTRTASGLLMLGLTLSIAGAKENILPTATISASSTFINLDCEGNACGQVTLTFDGSKQQYKVQNNSDRLVWVEASDTAGGRSVIVEPGKAGYLPMKSFIGPYRAIYE
jgi:hypothetical protein